MRVVLVLAKAALDKNAQLINNAPAHRKNRIPVAFSPVFSAASAEMADEDDTTLGWSW